MNFYPQKLWKIVQQKHTFFYVTSVCIFEPLNGVAKEEFKNKQNDDN